MSLTLVGKDTVKLNNRIINDQANGECGKLTFPNDKWIADVGKNGNAILSYSYKGLLVEFELRILRGSSDDKFLNGLANDADNNPAAFSLITGEIIKNLGDAAGNQSQDIYFLSGGVIKKGVDSVEIAEGGAEQAVAVYHLFFTKAIRTNN